MAFTRRIKLEFDDFGHSQLQAAAERHDLSLDEFVGRAARYSVSSHSPRGTSRRVPRLRRAFRGRWGRPRTVELTLALDLSAREWGALEAEAEVQGVPVERLVEHAALHMLADLESGKLDQPARPRQ